MPACTFLAWVTEEHLALKDTKGFSLIFPYLKKKKKNEVSMSGGRECVLLENVRLVVWTAVGQPMEVFQSHGW